MKGIYKFLMIIFGFMFFAFIFVILLSPFGKHSQLQNIIQGTSIFMAFFAAIIALATADRKRNQINISIDTSIDQSITYRENEMTDFCRSLYKKLPNKSHQVNFKMTNLSDFTLEHYTLTFELPYEKQPPYKKEGQTIYESRAYTSSIIQKTDLDLVFGENIIIATPFLPYSNKQDSITFWIRMVIDEPYKIKVAVNCINADGKTYPVDIDPKMISHRNL
jgi:hypothetical protein